MDELLASAGFPLRKWISNFPEILEGIDESHLAAGSKALNDSSVSTSVLGLCWNSTLDRFEFKVTAFDCPSKLTKRTVLLRIAKVFDPMGWLFPIIVTANILMQGLWLCKLSWDDELNPEHRSSWEKLVPSSVAFLSLVGIISTHQRRLWIHTSLRMHPSSRMVLRFICGLCTMARSLLVSKRPKVRLLPLNF